MALHSDSPYAILGPQVRGLQATEALFDTCRSPLNRWLKGAHLQHPLFSLHFPGEA